MASITLTKIRIWLYSRFLKPAKPSQKTVELLKKYMRTNKLSDDQVKRIKKIVGESK